MSSEVLRKSLIDQIIDDTIEKLENQNVFPENTIELFKELKNSGNFAKLKPILNAIKTELDEDNEAP